MKFRLVFFLLLYIPLISIASGKKDFIIEGKIGNSDAPAAIFLFYNDPVSNRPVKDSTVLEKGRFVLKGTIEYPVYAKIVYAFNGDLQYATAGDERQFYLESGNITINGRQLFNAGIKGSYTQELLEKYFELVNPIQKKMIETRKDMDDIYKPYSIAYRDSLDLYLNELNEKYNQVSMDFVEKHSNTFLAVDMLSSEITAHPDNDNVENLYEKLSPEIRQSAPGKRLSVKIRNRQRIQPGHAAPDFTADTLEGESISLSSYRGKWLLMVFWSPTCDICLREANELKQIYSKYKDKNFEILAFAIEENKNQWEKAVSDIQFPYRTVSDLKLWNSPIVQQYRINAVPENYLINPDGLITDLDIHGYSLIEKLNKVL